MAKRSPRPWSERQDSLHAAYQRHGVQGYYQRHGASYRNPHEQTIVELVGAFASQQSWPHGVLDLACGSGEVTLALRSVGVEQVLGVDPYTAEAYFERTGAHCEPLSFEQIALGGLGERRFSLVVCSFALHLLSESWLPRLCWALAACSPRLLLLSPHKRPKLEEDWGWRLREAWLMDRVHCRDYEQLSPNDDQR